MNNSKIVLDYTDDTPEKEMLPKLRAEESRLVRIIEAIQEVQQTKAWSTLKTEVFDNLVNVLEKDLRTEAEKPDPDPKKLNRLSGEIKWARRYSDLQKYENEKRVELQNIRINLHGKSE